MRKLVALILVVALALTGCATVVEGVPQEEYDALQAKYDALKADYDALKTDHETLAVELARYLALYGEEPAEETKPAPEGTFDEEEVISQLEVTEYFYDDDWYDYAFLAIKNNSEFNLSISVSVKFYNESGELIGAESDDQEAFESGTETILLFSPDEEYARLEYEISASEEDWYECVVSDLSYESTPAKEKEILAVTNNGKKAAEFVECYVLFFKGEEVVGFDSRYFIDDDSELKPGKTITEELTCYEDYDSVKFFFSGRRS